MTLEELSIEYQKSAQLIRDRLKLLREQLKNAENPEDVFWLKRRIAELTPMLTEMNKIAEITAHYYERGFWRDAQYSSNCFGEYGRKKAAAIKRVDVYSPERADEYPAGYVRQIPSEESIHHGDCRGSGSKQKHRKSHLTQSGTESKEIYQIPELKEDSLVKAFFDSDG